MPTISQVLQKSGAKLGPRPLTEADVTLKCNLHGTQWSAATRPPKTSAGTTMYQCPEGCVVATVRQGDAGMMEIDCGDGQVGLTVTR
jgi:hypothetical protein